MRERTKGFISGLLTAALLIALSTTIFAAAQSISVNGGVKIMLDGKSFVPKDANGNAVDVFEYNGTTYVPVRAVSQAFGKEITWDDTTRTVVIGSAASGTSPTSSGATVSQKNALSSAKSYLSFTAFSYEGLIDQLEYEKFSTEDATYAADNCGADWNDQALKSAKSYLKYSAFSYSGLISQLKYEKFTKEQATYGADNCGADWNEQAVKSAKSYLEYSSFSRSGLIDQLMYEGFTREQAEYGVSKNGL